MFELLTRVEDSNGCTGEYQRNNHYLHFIYITISGAHETIDIIV